MKPLRAVWNIDDKARLEFFESVLCEGVDVWITHIGGYPGKYNPKIKMELEVNATFICGHSHILKVMFDKRIIFTHELGACGVCFIKYVLCCDL
jgi:predicted phosphodiesterase